MTLSSPEIQATPRYSWSEVWTGVLTRPSVQTFQEILRDPAMSRRRAYTWMVITWAITIVFVMILSLRDSTELLASMPTDVKLSPSEMQSAVMLSTICMIPFALLIGIAAFRFMVWLVQFVARQLGAEANPEAGVSSPIKAKNSEPTDRKSLIGTQVTYTFAAIQAPLNIVSLLFAALPANPIVAVISLLATFYQFYLMTLALRTVYGLTAARAGAAIFVTFVAFFGLMLGLVSLLYSLV